MKKIVFLMIALLLILSFAGCTQQPQVDEPSQNEEREEADTIEVKVAGLKGPSSIGMIKMIDEKTSLGENVSSSYDIVGAPDTLVSKLLNGEYDFATLPTNVASIIYNKNGAYQTIGISTWGMLYVVTNGVEINEWADFSGQTIFPFAQGSTPDILFRHLLKQNGIDPENDVTFDYSIQQAELAQALAADQVSIAVLPEPFVTVATMKNQNIDITMNLQEEWQKAHATSSIIPVDDSYPMTAVVVRKEFAEQHPEIVSEYFNRYKASADWVNEHPKEASLLVEENDLGLAAKAAEKAIPRCSINLVKISECRTIVEFYLNIFNDFSPKSIGGSMPDESFYYGE